MTLEELRAKYPDEIAQAEAAARAAVDHTEAVNAAVQAERERMQSIDEIAGLLDDAGTEDVGATPPPEEEEETDEKDQTSEARMAAARANVAALFGKKKED